MSRRTDRRHAFNLVFQMEFLDTAPEELYRRYFDGKLFEADELSLSANTDKDYVMGALQGIREHAQHIDRKIAELARGFTPERLVKTDLAILRLAVYELLYEAGVPPKVAITEAVELSKVYSGGESPAFVNGLLGQLIRAKS